MLTLWKPKNLRPVNAHHANPAPATPALSLFDQFDRLIDQALDAPLSGAVGWGYPALGTFAADITETADGYGVSLDLPGVDPKDVDVRIEDDCLTIRAERKSDGKTDASFLRCERSYGAMQRSFTLPSAVDASKVEARYENGVLHVALPKREEARPKSITVQVK